MQYQILRHELNQANYTTAAVLERIGELGQAGLGRNTTVAADVALAGALDPQACLIRLFLLQQTVPVTAAAAALRVDELVAAELLAIEGDQVRALVDIRPYDSPDDGATGYLVSDLTPGMDANTAPTRPDYVLGASPASMTLTELTMRTPVGSALDLGTGCGVQSLHLARHCDKVVATDLNPRALQLAKLSAELSGADVEFCEGSLFEPVAGQRFDLIVSNPPYVMSPPQGERLTYRESVFQADGLVEAIVRGAKDHLNPGGSLQLLTNWAITKDQPWQDRLRGWIEPTGLDGWVIERERLDRFSYIELWLTDAGLAGSPQWEPAYRAWLDYFEQLGIEEVGMGWILLTAADRAQPRLRFESWPHAVQQPTGEVFARHQGALAAAELATEELLASRPRLDRVSQETLGDPGAVDPQYIVLRQLTGLRRAMKVDTLGSAVLGALDGELTLGQVITAVSQILELEPAAVAAEAIALVRNALAEQFLVVDDVG